MKATWRVVEECNVDGEATCWSSEINHPRYGRYVWITLNDGYDVEVENFGEIRVLVTCKTLASAKHWVSRYIL